MGVWSPSLRSHHVKARCEARWGLMCCERTWQYVRTQGKQLFPRIFFKWSLTTSHTSSLLHVLRNSAQPAFTTATSSGSAPCISFDCIKPFYGLSLPLFNDRKNHSHQERSGRLQAAPAQWATMAWIGESLPQAESHSSSSSPDSLDFQCHHRTWDYWCIISLSTNWAIKICEMVTWCEITLDVSPNIFAVLSCDLNGFPGEHNQTAFGT